MPPPFHRAANLSALPGIAHGFFGREGGVSDGVYASLNCGPGSKDDPERVAENRGRVTAALAPEAKLITLAQIHSPNVHVVGSDWEGRPEGDGMVAALPGLADHHCAAGKPGGLGGQAEFISRQGAVDGADVVEGLRAGVGAGLGEHTTRKTEGFEPFPRNG